MKLVRLKRTISFTEHLRSISEQSLRWRRDKVKESTIEGYTQREVSTELLVALEQVKKDLKDMRQEAKHNIKHYMDEYLPAEFQHCLDALNMIVKEMWNMETEDNRELMQSRTLIKECCAMRIDLLSNATVVDRAVKFVDRNKV